MELMGFQFTELQILALFARYDVSYTGEVDYHEFVDKLMEWDYGSGHMGAHGNKLNKMVSRVFGSGAKQSFDDEYDSDMDQEELEHFRNLEIKKIFDMIDKVGVIPSCQTTAAFLLPSPFSLLPSPFSLLPSPFSLLPSLFSLLPSPFSLLPDPRPPPCVPLDES